MPTITARMLRTTGFRTPPGMDGAAACRASRLLQPARDDDLLVGVELDAVASMRLEIAVERPLGTAEREVRHRRGHADVDAEHAGLDAIAVLACPLAARGEDAGRVAQLVLAHDRHRLVEVLRAHDAQHRAEDLLAP